VACSGLAADPEAARQALARGDFRAAEAIYRELLSAGEPSAELWSNLGLALHSQGRSSEALGAFRRSLKIRETPAALALIGLEYCRLGQFEQADDILRRARRYWNDAEVLKTLAPCYLDAGEPLDAVRIYERLVRQAPEGENFAGLARANFRASREFLKRLEKTPDSEPYVKAIRAARGASSPDARGAFPTALEKAPYLKPNLGMDEMSELLAAHPNDPSLFYVLGVVCGEQGMGTLLYCREKYASSPAVRRLNAEILASQGQDEAALAEYGALLRDAEQPGGLHYEIAMLYRKRGAWDKALAEFRLERQALPDDERAQVGIAESLLQLRRYEELAAHLKPVLEVKEAPEWALLDAATAAQGRGRPEEAIAYLKRLADQNPENWTTHYRLSRLYAITGRPELARRELALFRKFKRYQ
jgi:tetratricopeptide (TPR) repeat protein